MTPRSEILAGLTLAPDAPPEEVVGTIRRSGLAVLPGWLGGPRLEGLTEEFLRVVDDPGSGVVRAIDYAAGVARRLTDDPQTRTSFPLVADVFWGDATRAIASEWFAQEGFALNHELYVHRDLPRDEPINPLHFDRLRTLKFFLYLKDAAFEDGAIRVAPGSHHLAREIRRREQQWGTSVKQLPNQVLPPGLPPPVAVEGPAGTLVVFTTDVFHQGGRVEPGRERWVVRGHTRGLPFEAYQPKPLTAQWWRESRLYPLRYVGALFGRGPLARRRDSVDAGQPR